MLDPHKARQDLLLRSPRPLPLAHQGQPFVAAIRRQHRGQRVPLLRSFRQALDQLHGLGWGTDDPIQAARLTAGQRVVFAPDRVWPLGCTTARRPIARWLDLCDAASGLAALTLDVDLPPALTDVPMPWPGYPAPPATPTACLVGPQAELAALCQAAGLPWIGAGVFVDPSERQQALGWILAGQPFAIIAPAAGNRRAIAEVVLRVQATGGELEVQAPQGTALGMHIAHGLADSVTAPSNVSLAVALEAAELAPTPAGRDAARAGALLDYAVSAAQLDAGDATTTASLTQALALARGAGARRLTHRAHWQLALTWFLGGTAATAQHAEHALVQAERLARTCGDLRSCQRAVFGRSVLNWVRGDRAATTATPLALPQDVAEGDPTDTTELQAWSAIAGAANSRGADDGQAMLADRGRLLLIATLCLPRVLLAATLEGLFVTSVALGAEAALARSLRPLVDSLPAMTASGTLVRTFMAACHARRGATAMAGQTLEPVADVLTSMATAATAKPDGPATGLGPLARRAARWAAFTASQLGRSGLAAHLSRLVPDPPRLAHLIPAQRADVPQAGMEHLVLTNLALGHLTLIAEAALHWEETLARGVRAALAQRLEGREPNGIPPAAALALGRLEVRCFDRAAAKPLLAQAASRGSRHVEVAALNALAAWHADASSESDDARAVMRRLQQLKDQRPPPIVLAPPPLTHDAAAAAEVALVRQAALAAAQESPLAWSRAVEALCGPLDGAPPMPSHAKDGLVIDHNDDGFWLSALGQAPVRLQGPPIAAPRAVERALAALAPMFVMEDPSSSFAHEGDAATHAKRWAIAADRALSTGQADFDSDIITAYRRHDLTRMQLRWLVHLGLSETGGLYRSATARWQIPETDYQRVMDFLRRAGVALDYRRYRSDAPPTQP